MLLVWVGPCENRTLRPGRAFNNTVLCHLSQTATHTYCQTLPFQQGTEQEAASLNE